jgi:hypothetical protein
VIKELMKLMGSHGNLSLLPFGDEGDDGFNFHKGLGFKVLGFRV